MKLRQTENSTYGVWLVGCGGMAAAYARVLQALGTVTTVVGRGSPSAVRFSDLTGLPVTEGGLRAFLGTEPPHPKAAIVAVGVEHLAEVVDQLLRYGVTAILVEKPGALHRAQLVSLAESARQRDANVFIAYNRRFFASTIHGMQLLEDDGGVESMHFEFTEWGHQIQDLVKGPGVLSAWFLANSTHVADLAFYLGGLPTELHAHTSGTLAWHPAASSFAGSGRTDRGALFSYQANWNAPGRWALELISRNIRVIFRPMEQLHVMRTGSVAVELVSIDDRLDVDFKPGLYEQVSRFLSGNSTGLCTLSRQLATWDWYCKIAGYES